MKIYILGVLFCLTLISCNNKRNDLPKFQKYIETSFENHQLLDNQLYVFIPKDMCSTCVAGVINYFNTLSNKEKNKITGVFVGNSSKELAFITNDLKDKSNILLDGKEAAYNMEFISDSHCTIVTKVDNDFNTFSFLENNLFLITNKIDDF